VATNEETANKVAPLVTIVSGVVLAIASFLKWVSVTATVPALNISKTFSASGMDASDGKYTLTAGIVAIVAGGLALAGTVKMRVLGILSIIFGAIAVIVGVIDYGDASSQADLPAAVVAAGGKVEGSASFGLYLVIIAGIGVLVGGILLLRSRTTTVSPTTAPATPPAGTDSTGTTPNG
jgi:hypothetical protein